MRDRYFDLIDHIVQITLQGNIRSKEQVYQLLVEGVSVGTGEIFEQCLIDRVATVEQQVKAETDEFKQAKANRRLRAMQTIKGEWEHWQEKNQTAGAIAQTLGQLTTAEPSQRLTVFLRAIDPNRPQAFNATQLKQLANALQQQLAEDSKADHPIEDQQDLQQLATGIFRGLESWSHLQEHLVSAVYEQGQEQQIGFNHTARGYDPWSAWAKYLTSPLPLALFRALSVDQLVHEVIAQFPQLDMSAWVELIVLLQYMHQSLIAWFDRLVYDAKVGSKLSISIFLTFSILWSQLARGIEQATTFDAFNRSRFADSAFQLSLQILRVFSQRAYFPLYGGVFASLPGSQLRSVVSYLNEPLRRVEGTQEKARILTLIGASERARGFLVEAKELHDIAREIAADAGDRPCEIANLNHLSRTTAAQKAYGEAIDFSQRALILSRQVGDRPGQANALVNLGYSEVLQAQQIEQADPAAYESAIGYLQQGLKLAEELGDRQSQAFACNSLGIAYIVLEDPETAVKHLLSGLKAAQAAGDLYLQGLDLAYLAEAYYRLQQPTKALYASCLSMYYLERIAARDWRQPAGLITILQGQMGDGFQTAMVELRGELIAAIGVDGYDYLPQLIEKYRHPE